MKEASGKKANQPVTAAPLAKLSLPHLAQGTARPRLFQALDEGRKGAALWIAAPGGAGKTTLAATYLLKRQLPYLWYQLDEDDADPATFFYYLGIAARQATCDERLFLPLLTPEYLPDIPGFARRYFRDLYARLPRDTMLVLDNYQDLGEAAIFAEILRRAIGEIPQGANLLIISRSEPPPELARHRATGELAILDWDTMRLTRDETRAIVADSLPLDENIIHTLHRRAEGWAAGVTLLLEQIKRKGMDDWVLGPSSLETVFHFFANEFFNDLAETTRDFLLKTALLSHMTPTLAEQVSGNGEADQILAELHRRHFFTNRRDLGEISYQYHALFREFLLAKAAERYTREQYLALTRRAGRLLSQHRRHEEAVALHLQAQDWETAIPLLLGHAPQLLAQGRAQIVATWIQQMPEALVESLPWLLYWKGMSQMAVQPFDAQETLRRAYSGFDDRSDVMGRMLTASAIIDITYFLRMSLLSAIQWFDVLQNELALNPSFPSSAIEGRILTSLISTLMYMRPQDMQLSNYARRLLAILDDDMDVNQKVMIGSQLVHYYTLVEGDPQASECVAMRIRPLLDSQGLTILNKIMWRVLSAAPLTITNRQDEAFKTVLPLLSLVKDNNLVFMESLADLYVANVYFQFNEETDFTSLLGAMEDLTNSTQSADIAWLNIAKTLLSLKQGDYAAAVRYGETTLRLISGLGATLIEMELSCLLAIACCENGGRVEAHAYLYRPKYLNFGNSARIRREAFQAEAYIHLQQGELSKCHTLLREAFSIAKARGYFGSWLCWHRPMMIRLCAEALRAGIEVKYVRQLIRKRRLLPEDSTIEDWPWPVRIFTLGHFKVEVDDQVITESRAQRKPLILLQAVIALGGTEAKVDRVAEILWPDAEGDAAISAFTTTVSRLRKLIGNAVVVKGGRVSLDERRCWLDVRALERRLDRAYDPASTDIMKYAEQLLGQYRGPFLVDEEGEWAWRLRKRLREKFSRRLAQCASALLAAGKREVAARLLEKAAAADPDAVNGYRDLMSGLVSEEAGK